MLFINFLLSLFIYRLVTLSTITFSCQPNPIYMSICVSVWRCVHTYPIGVYPHSLALCIWITPIIYHTHTHSLQLILPFLFIQLYDVKSSRFPDWCVPNKVTLTHTNYPVPDQLFLRQWRPRFESSLSFFPPFFLFKIYLCEFEQIFINYFDLVGFLLLLANRVQSSLSDSPSDRTHIALKLWLLF